MLGPFPLPLRLRLPARCTRMPRVHMQVAAIIAFTAVLTWAGVATWMLLFRDDVVASLIVRQQRLTLAYEDQLVALRRQLDLVASRQYLEQERVEERLARLLERQRELEHRQAQVDALQRQANGLDRARDNIPSPVAAGAGAGHHIPAAKGARHGDAEKARLGVARYVPVSERLARTDAQLASLAQKQAAALSGMLASSRQRLDRYLDVVRAVGLPTEPLERLPDGLAGEGIGGPYVPVQAGASMQFDSLAESLRHTLTLAERAADVVNRLPLGRPAETGDTTSPFGVRLDPFLRSPALHTGIDFRAPYGAPVRATGPGKVVFAGHGGGYGYVVEIEHVSGVTTRYAHLSAITVREGDAVAAGDVVGNAGSTGRSTGPHIHYETRIGGQPVDPQRFIAAGRRLAEIH